MRSRYLDHDGPLAIAHRGGADERAENTWASFTHAVDLGYRWLETDVHATADGVVAVIHDPSLDRVSDRTGVVGELRWADVAAARLEGGQAVPRLEELIDAWPDVCWNIDAKHDAVVDPLVAALRRTGAIDRVCVTSFSDRRVARVRRLVGPGLCTATGPQGITGLRLLSLLPALGPVAVLPGPWLGASASQVPVRWGRVPVVDARYLRAAHRLGLAVHVWTVDEEREMERLLDLGVDGIMTDRPSLLRRVLERRGQWTGPGAA